MFDVFNQLQRLPGIAAVAFLLNLAEQDVRETRGQNRGPWVDRLVELGGGDDDEADPWCAYAGWGSWRAACTTLGLELVSSTSGGVVRSWHKNDGHRFTAEQVRANPSILEPGDLMCRVREAKHMPRVLAGGSAPGHMDMFVRLTADRTACDLVGGNTNVAGSAEGDGVYYKPAGIALDDPRLIGFIRPRVRVVLTPELQTWHA